MKTVLKILLVCLIIAVALRVVALVGIFAYNRMRDDTAKTTTIPCVVKRGETLTVIANRTRSTVEELATLNDLPNTNHITEGRTLKVPKKG
jgi:hypothetical protein